MATYVLIHGSFHGGWCWEKVAALLEGAGHKVLTPDLPGMGTDQTDFAADCLNQWADAVADMVRAQDEPVILAGHSLAGAVIAQAAERATEGVARLVFIAALLMRDGDAAMGKRALAGLEAGEHPFMQPCGGGMTRAKPEGLNELIYSDASDADRDAALARICPQPLNVMTTPLKLSEERFGAVPRGYIETTQDKVLPIDFQRTMQGNWPCERVITLDTGHTPLASAPGQLVEALIAMA